MKRKIVSAALLLALFFTQTGFITGLVTMPVGGAAAAAGGAAMVAHSASLTSCCLTGWGACLMCGCGGLSYMSKDSKNKCASCVTGLWAAMGLAFGKKGEKLAKAAKELGVSEKDIISYQEIDDEIHIIGNRLLIELDKMRASYPSWQKWDGKPETRSSTIEAIEESLLKDSNLEAFAKMYGFKDSKEVVEIFKTNKISKEALERFAESNAVRLPYAHAKILLRGPFKMEVAE